MSRCFKDVWTKTMSWVVAKSAKTSICVPPPAHALSPFRKPTLESSWSLEDNHCKFTQGQGQILAIVSDAQIWMVSLLRLVGPQDIWFVATNLANNTFFCLIRKEKTFAKEGENMYSHWVDNNIHLHLFSQGSGNVHTLHHKIWHPTEYHLDQLHWYISNGLVSMRQFAFTRPYSEICAPKGKK